MSDREKLIELIDSVLECLPWGEISTHTAKDIADYLISNGVTVQKSNCPYCCDDGEGSHGSLKYSYDDEDGMTMSIHPSPKRKDGTRSLVWWATVRFREECRDFIIEVCPFCGRRLVPLKEELQCASEPPKECE